MSALLSPVARVVPRLFQMPIAAVNPCSVSQANDLMIEWGHRLGPCARPFYQEAYALEVGDHIVCVAISAGIVSATVDRYNRFQVVELSRLCAAPGYSWANRVLLRMWRECCAHLWPEWPVEAAISYSQNAHHRGDLYRFDGWEKGPENCGSSGGGTHTKKRTKDDAVSGNKTLWLWRYQP